LQKKTGNGGSMVRRTKRPLFTFGCLFENFAYGPPILSPFFYSSVHRSRSPRTRRPPRRPHELRA
jgi:hypothetical protein